MRTLDFPEGQFDVIDAGHVCYGPDGKKSNFWTEFEANRYEPGTIKRMRKLLKPGDYFLDIGAWMGGFSLFAHLLGARALAVEPDPVASMLLKVNLQQNLFPCRFYKAALAPERGTLHLSGSGDGLSRISEEGTEVTALPIDLVATERPRFAKIDVEGYETELMPSLGPWLARNNVAAQISLHGEWIDRKCLSIYPTVIWPTDPYGDIVALPFLTMDAKEWL